MFRCNWKGAPMSIFFILTTLLMVAVFYFDIRHYLIPNWIVGLMLLMYPLAVWLSPAAVDWKTASLLAIAVFAVGYIIFIMRWMGGGDIKLLVACSLWVGGEGFPDFIFSVAIMGGLLSVSVLLARFVANKVMIQRGSNAALPKLLTHGAPVPYGVAIAGVFLWMMWSGQLVLLPMI